MYAGVPIETTCSYAGVLVGRSTGVARPWVCLGVCPVSHNSKKRKAQKTRDMHETFKAETRPKRHISATQTLGMLSETRRFRFETIETCRPHPCRKPKLVWSFLRTRVTGVLKRVRVCLHAQL